MVPKTVKFANSILLNDGDDDYSSLECDDFFEGYAGIADDSQFVEDYQILFKHTDEGKQAITVLRPSTAAASISPKRKTMSRTTIEATSSDADSDSACADYEIVNMCSRLHFFCRHYDLTKLSEEAKTAVRNSVIWLRRHQMESSSGICKRLLCLSRVYESPYSLFLVFHKSSREQLEMRSTPLSADDSTAVSLVREAVWRRKNECGTNNCNQSLDDEDVHYHLKLQKQTLPSSMWRSSSSDVYVTLSEEGRKSGAAIIFPGTHCVANDSNTIPEIVPILTLGGAKRPADSANDSSRNSTGTSSTRSSWEFPDTALAIVNVEFNVPPAVAMRSQSSCRRKPITRRPVLLRSAY